MTAAVIVTSRHRQIRAMATHRDRVLIRCPIRGCIDLHLYGPQAAALALLIRNQHRNRATDIEILGGQS